MTLAPKNLTLIAGILSSIGAIIILIFFSSWVSDPINPYKIYVAVKPQYESLVWGILSVSSALYYMIRSGGKTTSGGYINPLFKWALNFAQIVPFLGLLLSGIKDTEFLFGSSDWKYIILALDEFLKVVLIFFVFTHFGAGISAIRQYWKGNTL